jgi:hypothetical protein
MSGHEIVPGVDRPWERPGAVRRDCAPHRGKLLLALSGGAMGGAVLSALLLGVVVIHPLGLAVCAYAWLAGVALGGTALTLARRDLRRMDAGLMDPEGWPATKDARSLALGSLPISAVVLLVGVGGWVLTARVF